MKRVKLVKPSPEYMDSYLAACWGFKELGLLSYSFKDPDEYHVWGTGFFEKIAEKEEGVNLPEGYVPATTFWLVEDGEFIGEGNIRHCLTPALQRFGGHIGYAVRIDKWGKGYGSIQLSLLLREAALLGIDKALLTCNEENTASAKIMEKNGGIYIDTIDNYAGGKAMRTKRYIIDARPHLESIISESAWLYDLDMLMRSKDSEDISFYLAAAGGIREKNGVCDILELGCGTGRIAIELANAGHRVHGVDLSSVMLDIFRDKRNRLPEDVRGRLSLYHQNMASFSVPGKFGLIIAPGCSFQALITDADIHSCLEAVRNGLAPGGRFVFDVFRPFAAPGLEDGWHRQHVLVWETKDSVTGNHIAKFDKREEIDTSEQILRSVISYEITLPNGSVETLSDRCALKYYYCEQLQALLKSHDFRILNEYGGYDMRQIESGSKMIFVCERE